MRFTVKSALVGALTLGAMLVPLQQGRATTSVPNPTVEGPITAGLHGRPWESSLVNLAEHGYLEQEPRRLRVEIEREIERTARHRRQSTRAPV